ncbi:hypothetical protein SDC9_132119 [bioreactor metagenome]|uniref:ParB/Sulfiredoxin domain-containing protein n=1 Tax=bioreactor metagenome TaxID=1076179 RepID=A0A645D8V1_9ZZZZ
MKNRQKPTRRAVPPGYISQKLPGLFDRESPPSNRIRMIITSELRSEAPFNELFPPRPSLLAEITADMKQNGYDSGRPIIMGRASYDIAAVILS